MTAEQLIKPQQFQTLSQPAFLESPESICQVKVAPTKQELYKALSKALPAIKKLIKGKTKK